MRDFLSCAPPIASGSKPMVKGDRMRPVSLNFRKGCWPEFPEERLAIQGQLIDILA
jgi:hypothetical protein